MVSGPRGWVGLLKEEQGTREAWVHHRPNTNDTRSGLLRGCVPWED